jgi:hypothetical protein
VDASIKLPALYLLDSICKNIHAPYAALFAQRIERIFLSAYRDVDPPTKIKMEELLGTWRTGGPNGTELFQGRAQRDIEIALFGSQLKGGGIAGRSANANPHFLSGVRRSLGACECVQSSEQIQQLPSMASKAERNTVTSDLRRLQAIWEMRATMHPEDDGPRVQIDALKQVGRAPLADLSLVLEHVLQLEHILNTATLTSDAIANIRADINKLHPTDSVPLITPRPVPAPSQPHLASIDFSKLAGILPIRSGSQQPSAAPTPPPSSAPPAHDPLALLRSLNLDAFKGLPGFGQALPAPAVDNSELDYEQAVLKMDMHLTASDISRCVALPFASESSDLCERPGIGRLHPSCSTNVSPFNASNAPPASSRARAATPSCTPTTTGTFGRRSGSVRRRVFRREVGSRPRRCVDVCLARVR